ncbi:MAG: DoxX family protein [Candidatus Kaiserbacteria bacterium]|nr:MAG: DoxX family protein [Candidatus Kaiserbacteria bacterium]
MSDLSRFALPLLRFGLVALFLWFGISQVLDPAAWSAWVPQWPTDLTGLSAETIVFLNGSFEVVFGALLALGLFTRVVAVLLSLHLLFIAYEVGYNDVGVRDFTLAIATISIALFGADQFSLDRKWNRG